MNIDTWAVMFATVSGPLTAVLITIWLQRRAQKYDRRLDVFRAMMRSRRAMITPEWVGALNLVQVEFSDERDVMDAFTRLLDRYSDPAFQGTDAQRQTANDNIDVAAAELLQKMATVLGINLRGADLRRAYLPQGWNSDDQELRRLRFGVFQLLSGQRAIKVEVVQDALETPVPNPKEHGQN